MSLNTEEMVFDMLHYYYGHPERFSFIGKNDGSATCAYLNPDNKVCGVGRCFNRETMNILRKLRVEEPEIFADMNTNDFGSFRDFMRNRFEIEEVFEPKYQGHAPNEWNMIQTLHDDFAVSNPTYWTKTAELTPMGIAYLVENMQLNPKAVNSVVNQLKADMFAETE